MKTSKSFSLDVEVVYKLEELMGENANDWVNETLKRELEKIEKKRATQR